MGNGAAVLTLKHCETHRCVVSTVATDALVLKHQAISILSTDSTFNLLDQFQMKILDFCWTTFRNKITYWKKWPSRLRVKWIHWFPLCCCICIYIYVVLKRCCCLLSVGNLLVLGWQQLKCVQEPFARGVAVVSTPPPTAANVWMHSMVSVVSNSMPTTAQV